MKAIILSIGDELILGQTLDTNAAYLSQKIYDLGLTIKYHHTCDDSLQDIKDAILNATTQADLLLITGGLGPTPDDLTRNALAEALQQPLQLHTQALTKLQEWFHSYQKEMTPNNQIQAMLPKNTTPIPNDCGTAPGIQATLNHTQIFVMPGVPREMKQMFTQYIQPKITQQFPQIKDKTILTKKINTFGQGESAISQTLGNILNRNQNPIVGTTVANGIVSIRIRAEFPTKKQAIQQLQQTTEKIYQALGHIIFGQEEQSLATATLQTLKDQNITLATAESCTGGLLSQMITDIPGASQIFLGSFITYHNQFKIKQLGIDPKIIQDHGAVSPQVAKHMAQNTRKKSNAKIAIAITGIAGPQGGSPQKPIGTVHIALATGNAPTKSYPFLFKGSRQIIRHRAALTALQIIRYHALNINDQKLFWQKTEHHITQK